MADEIKKVEETKEEKGFKEKVSEFWNDWGKPVAFGLVGLSVGALGGWAWAKSGIPQAVAENPIGFGETEVTES